jgi:hypothetical protein
VIEALTARCNYARGDSGDEYDR